MAMIYRIPFVPFKIAATTRITAPASGLYGSGALGGTLTPLAPGGPVSQKLRSIYDSRPTSSPSMPYYVWGAKIADPDGSRSTTFHAAGVEQLITSHVYSGWQNSTDEIDEICDKLSQLFHHQPLVMAGYTTLVVSFRVVDVIPDPVGQHAIVEFNPLIQVTPT